MAGSASTAKPGSVAFRESAKPGKDHLDINMIFREPGQIQRWLAYSDKDKDTGNKKKDTGKKRVGSLTVWGNINSYMKL